MLQEFITVYRDEIIRRCRAKVAKKVIPPPGVGVVDETTAKGKELNFFLLSERQNIGGVPGALFNRAPGRSMRWKGRMTSDPGNCAFHKPRFGVCCFEQTSPPPLAMIPPL